MVKTMVWNKLLRVNLSKNRTKPQDLSKKIIEKYLGGNGLGIKLLFDETNGKVDPYSEENPLIFVPGLLNGSGIPMTEKCAFYSKSPLTGMMGEAVLGAGLGEQVKNAGYDALLINGRADTFSYLLIDENGAKIIEAEELAGLTTEKTEEILTNRHGGNAVVIGPAGENLVRFALINGDGRQAGRTGMGAIMGWKNLKGIVVNGWKKEEPAHPEKVKELQKNSMEEFLQGKGKESFEAYRDYGTVKASGAVSEIGMFPTRYWESGSFDGAKKLSSYEWEDHISENRGCNRCPCRCGQVYKDLVDVEYETSFSLGSNLCIDSIQDVAKANYLCDIYGIDTISMGNVIGFLMKLSEEGFIDKKLSFGDPKAVQEIIRKTTYREGIGDIAAEGVQRIGSKYGKEELAVHVNGLSPPAYDPRAVKGMGLAFYTSTRGASHLRSDCDGIEISGGYTPDDQGEWVEMEGDRLSTGQKQYIPWRENYITLHDTLGSCKLTGRSVYSPKLMSKLVNAYIGTDFSKKEIYKLGERIYNLEQLYNLQQKPEIKEKIHVPQQFQTPSPAEPVKGSKFTKKQVKTMLKAYYKVRGWNKEGVPTAEKLKELQLEDSNIST